MARGLLPVMGLHANREPERFRRRQLMCDHLGSFGCHLLRDTLKGIKDLQDIASHVMALVVDHDICGVPAICVE